MYIIIIHGEYEVDSGLSVEMFKVSQIHHVLSNGLLAKALE